MSVFTATIDRHNGENRLKIFRSEWVVYPEPTIKAEIVDVALDSDAIISLRPFGFVAVGWNSYRDEDGRQVSSTFCRSIGE